MHHDHRFRFHPHHVSQGLHRSTSVPRCIVLTAVRLDGTWPTNSTGIPSWQHHAPSLSPITPAAEVQHLTLFGSSLDALGHGATRSEKHKQYTRSSPRYCSRSGTLGSAVSRPYAVRVEIDAPVHHETRGSEDNDRPTRGPQLHTDGCFSLLCAALVVAHSGCVFEYHQLCFDSQARLGGQKTPTFSYWVGCDTLSQLCRQNFPPCLFWVRSASHQAAPNDTTSAVIRGQLGECG